LNDLRHSSFLKSVLTGAAIALIAVGVWVIYNSPSSVPVQGQSLPRSAPRTGPVYITVESGDTAASIGKRLQAADIIDSGASFQRLAKIIGAEAHLAAGEYEFLPGTSVLDALTRIRDGLTAARVVTVREGLRIEQVAQLMQDRGVVSASDFLAAANQIAAQGSSVDPDLLASRPPSSSLEGYLFPATYSFAPSVTGNQVVLEMLDALSTRLTPELRQAAADQGLTIHQVLTLASIVEREAVLPEERPIIASVYRNRMAQGMPLQADPTVQYAITALPGDIVQYGYWKLNLTLDDLKYDSAYNTYVNSGLPPGPIANPGIDSIIAVIHPAQTNYLYFVARNDGSHAFAETFAEHQANVARYQP
jgi:UPF0755 protein